MNKFITLLLMMFAMALADSSSSSTTTSLTNTLVWVTGTDKDGVTRTTQSAYKQDFQSLHDGTTDVLSGSMGLGSLSGRLGQIRTYERTTIAQANQGSSQRTGLFINMSRNTKLVVLVPILSLLAVTLL